MVVNQQYLIKAIKAINQDINEIEIIHTLHIIRKNCVYYILRLLLQSVRIIENYDKNELFDEKNIIKNIIIHNY